MPVSTGPGSAHASHRRSRGRRCPPTAGPRWARADAKFKSRRSCEEAAPGIVGGARPRSTMGGSAAPCTAASGLLQLRRGGPVARGRRGRIPAPGPEGAGVPDHHATPAAGSAPEGPRSRGARHQVIPQEASRIGPGAQDGICMSMAELAPEGLKTDSGLRESGSARPSAVRVLGRCGVQGTDTHSQALLHRFVLTKVS